MLRWIYTGAKTVSAVDSLQPVGTRSILRLSGSTSMGDLQGGGRTVSLGERTAVVANPYVLKRAAFLGMSRAVLGVAR